MDLDSFFIVPDNCLIVVKGRPGELSYSQTMMGQLNKIGAAENQDLYRNPLANKSEIVKQLGSVAIYGPGDTCPNFEYHLLLGKNDIYPPKEVLPTHFGLIRTPLTAEIGLREYDISDDLTTSIDEIYAESIIPKAAYVNNNVKRDIPDNEPGEEPHTFEDLVLYNESTSGLYITHLKNKFTITQKELLRLDANGVARRPGVYYNFVCRKIETPYYNRKAYNFTDKVNPSITSIISEPAATRRVFNRILNESIRRRKPLFYNGSAGTRRRPKT